jgi:signal transduction histidine kinase
MGRSDYRLLTYVAGLEFALDRLRSESAFLRNEAFEVARRITTLCNEGAAGAPAALASIQATTSSFVELLQDLGDPMSDEDSQDQAAQIAFRLLVISVFRRQQRLLECPHAELHLELSCEEIVWFPVRLRHILENLIANALKGVKTSHGEVRVQVQLGTSTAGYELRVTDNGVGLTQNAQSTLFELFDRAQPSHLAAPIVELAVLKLIIEQSGGELFVESIPGQGASFVAHLPRFQLADFLN